jgi:uncharacterized protein YraI
MGKRTIRLLILVLIALILSMAVASTSAQNFGTGWVATFYNNTNFSGTATATIANINGLNFNWASGVPIINGVPVTGIGTDNFSARFTSTQNFPVQASYTFSVAFDDNIRVIIDGSVAFEEFTGGPIKTRTFTRDLTAGAHALTVEYVEVTADAVLQVQWNNGGPAATVGPSPTPGPTSTPAPTGLPSIAPGALSATVIRAAVLNVRSGPFLGAPRVGRILRGQTYAVVGRDPDARWFLLQLSDKQAWAWGYYLAVNGNEFNAPVVGAFVTQGSPASTSGVVAQTNAGMRLRADATIYSAQIGRIPWGDLLPVIGRTSDGTWWQVVFRGTVGWVFSSYLDVIEGDVSTVPVTR